MTDRDDSRSEMIPANDACGRAILTVRQLKDILDGVDEDTHVVFAASDWYMNVQAVALPSEESGYVCVTLFPGAEFDARQV